MSYKSAYSGSQIDSAIGAILASPKIKIGAFTRSLALGSSSQSITGIGFTPSAVVIIGSDDSTCKSIGFTDLNSTGCVYQSGATSGHTANTAYLTEPGWAYGGVVSSMDADGFTIDWTLYGSGNTGTGSFYYMAFR